MDAKTVVEPTEQEVQKNLDKDDGLERIKHKLCKKSKDLPSILPP